MTDWAKLREPFPPDRIGLLPRATSRDAKPGLCGTCGKWHKQPAIHLDYVGHGAVTERLLDVDPEWSWEPVAYDDHGLPAISRRGEMAVLWIRLTIGGVTRFGVGTARAVKDDVEKELIGDAIRNAAMRFGVALDLWVKGDKQEGNDDSDTVRKDESPEDIIRRKANQYKLDLMGLAGGKDLARQLWEDAAAMFGLAADDVPESEQDATEIYEAAIVALREMRSMNATRFDPATPEFTDEQTAPFDLEDDK